MIHKRWIVREPVYDKDERDANHSKQRKVDPWPEAKEWEESKHIYHCYFQVGRISAGTKHNWELVKELLQKWPAAKDR